jgi:hypothetical protein
LVINHGIIKNSTIKNKTKINNKILYILFNLSNSFEKLLIIPIKKKNVKNPERKPVSKESILNLLGFIPFKIIIKFNMKTVIDKSISQKENNIKFKSYGFLPVKNEDATKKKQRIN